MLKQRLIPLSDKNVWKQMIQSVPHTYAHTHWYNLAMNIASKRPVFLYSAEAGDFRALCPLSLRQKKQEDPFDLATPYGFSGLASVGNYAGFMDEWNLFLKENGFVCGHVALHPFFINDAVIDLKSVWAGKKAYFIDLRKETDVHFKQLSTDHRQRLKQWINKNYLIKMDKSKENIDAFINLYKSSLETRNAAAVYNFGEEAWKMLINSEHSYIFSVIVDNQVEASALFVHYNDFVDYYMIASTPEGRQHARGVIWKAMEFFKSQHVSWMQLGCGIKENDSLDQFKARFGGEAHTTYSLRQIYNEETYQQLCAKYQAEPRNLTGYFPSYWQS